MPPPPHRVLALGLALASPAISQSLEMIDGTDQFAFVEVAGRFGEARLDRGRDNPVVVGTMNGVNYGLFLMGCDPACSSVQFYATWRGARIGPDRINEWNRMSRFAKAYLNVRGTPTLEMDVNIDGGVTRANFIDTFELWRVLSTGFARNVIGG